MPGARGRRPAARRRHVDNAGSLPADQPSLNSTWLAGGTLSRASACHRVPAVRDRRRWRPARRARSRSGPRIRTSTSVTVDARSEGADLEPADNSTVAGFLPAPPFDLAVAAEQRLERGIKVRVRGVAAARARVTAA